MAGTVPAADALAAASPAALTGAAASSPGSSDDPKIPVTPGGPAGVSSQLKHDQARIHAGYRHDYSDSWLQPYYQFKSRQKRSNGLSFSADYNALGQWASSSLSEDDSAFGGVFRFYGRWEAVGRGGAEAGALVWKIENRSAYGDSINPHELGAEIGLIAKTTDFNDYGWGVTNLQWQQHFRDGKSLVAVGQVDVHEWHDVFAFNSPWTDIKNTALVYPTSPIPSQGLGAMGFSMFGEHIYGLVGISDANGKPYEWGYETFFELREYFSYAEIGYVRDQSAFHDDNVHLSVWHVDARTDDGYTPEGWGLSVSGQWKLPNQWHPVLRLGWSDGGGGAPAEAAVTAGVGIDLPDFDRFFTGFNWSRPSDEDLRESLTWEAYYRFQLSPNLAIWPDLQVIFRPANNPRKDVVSVFSITARLVF